MSLAAEARSALRLTRPAQWPILTAQFAVGVMLAFPVLPADAGLWTAGAPGVLLAAWAVWVILLNGGTLAFNSSYDRDTGPVAYLRNPPAPPPWLPVAAATAMTGGAVLGAVYVGRGFGLVVALCVLLSVLYSHPAVRLKARPGFDLVTNMAGYGAGTTAAGILAGTAARAAAAGPVPAAGWWFIVGFGLLFGSFYPTTQIYQIRDDRARGDRTLATALGPSRSLLLAVVLGTGAAAAFGAGLAGRPDSPTWPLILCMGLWLGHLVLWMTRSGQYDDRRHERGMYVALALWAATDVGLLVCWFG